MITGRQIRAAKALLEWSAEDLAREAGLTRVTVSKIETETVQPQAATLEAILAVFDRNGVEFLPDEGVRVRKNEIRVFTGKPGYRNLLDHIYETMEKSGGRIRQLTSDGRYLPYADDYVKPHLERMGKIKNLDARVLTFKGDFNFPAKYCTYRWLEPALRVLSPFYVYGDFVVLSTHEAAYKKELISINSKLLAQRYVEQFDYFWTKASIPKERGKK